MKMMMMMMITTTITTIIIIITIINTNNQESLVLGYGLWSTVHESTSSMAPASACSAEVLKHHLRRGQSLVLSLFGHTVGLSVGT